MIAGACSAQLNFYSEYGLYNKCCKSKIERVAGTSVSPGVRQVSELVGRVNQNYIKYRDSYFRYSTHQK